MQSILRQNKGNAMISRTGARGLSVCTNEGVERHAPLTTTAVELGNAELGFIPLARSLHSKNRADDGALNRDTNGMNRV